MPENGISLETINLIYSKQRYSIEKPSDWIFGINDLSWNMTGHQATKHKNHDREDKIQRTVNQTFQFDIFKIPTIFNRKNDFCCLNQYMLKRMWRKCEENARKQMLNAADKTDSFIVQYLWIPIEIWRIINAYGWWNSVGEKNWKSRQYWILIIILSRDRNST